MFRITSETCHASTLQEILILAAMNVESTFSQPGATHVPRLQSREDISRLFKFFAQKFAKHCKCKR